MTSYVLGGGCFWCLDAIYRRTIGVTSVESGYAGGQSNDPDYYKVSNGDTGHAEVVRVTFDELVISGEVILDIFFLSHDPTTLNRQGADVGTQYRSIMLYGNSQQKQLFESAITRSQELYAAPIVTELQPLSKFYPAEAEHQDYFSKNPGAGYCSVVIAPKLAAAKANFQKWFKNEEY